MGGGGVVTVGLRGIVGWERGIVGYVGARRGMGAAMMDEQGGIVGYVGALQGVRVATMR